MKDKFSTAKNIQLASKGFAIVDEEFYPSLMLHKWQLHKGTWDKVGYATRRKMVRGKVFHLYLHHSILPKLKGFDVDHKNGNTLDNRRSNLRYLTHRENSISHKESK